MMSRSVQLFKVVGVLGIMLVIALFTGWLTMRFLLEGGNVVVPEVVGKNVREAGELLARQDLHLKLEEQYDPLVPRGRVISQRPPAHAFTKKAREVKVTVSLGQREILVPDVVGEKVARARNILLESDLAAPEIVQVHSAERPQGVVIAQSPGAYRTVQAGIRAKLLVSQGPPMEGYYMMDFRGKPLDEVKELIRNLELRVGKVDQEPSPTVRAGMILRQTPPPGFKVLAGSAVELVVSQGAGAAATTREGILAPFRYLVPQGNGSRAVRIVVENQAGRKELFHQQRQAGEEIRLLVSLAGETALKVYLDGSLVEEHVIKP